MMGRSVVWLSTALAVVVVLVTFFAGGQFYALGLGVGFTWGVLTVGIAVVIERRPRVQRCGALAPVDAELGMTTCVRPDGHTPPHRDERGEEW